MLRLIITLVLFGMTGFGHATIFLSTDEANSLKQFFYYVLKESEAGYVIEGVKPVCVLGVEERGDLYAGHPIHKNSLVFKKGLQIWNSKFSDFNILSPVQIKTFNRPDSEVRNCKHFLFIHKDLFFSTVDKNLSLFRYVLGPTLTTQAFYDTLNNSSKDFSQIFGGHDNVLVGIVLGYGTENALIVSRLEALQNNKGLFPSIGFKSIEDEKNSLSDLIILPPDELTKVKPYFLYGYKKNDSNSEDFHKKLLVAQSLIQKKIEDPELLKKIVLFLTGQDLVIVSNSVLLEPINEKIESLVAKGLLKSLYLHGYSKEEVKSLIVAMESLNVEEKPTGLKVKAQDLTTFYSLSQKFDIKKLTELMKLFQEDPPELSPSEEIQLDNFYSEIYEI